MRDHELDVDEMVSTLELDLVFKDDQLKEAREVTADLWRELCWWRDWYRSEYGTDSRT